MVSAGFSFGAASDLDHSSRPVSMELESFTLKIKSDDREHELHYADEFDSEGHAVVWQTCNRLYDVCQDWQAWAGERLGDLADTVLVVPDVHFEHAIGCAVLAIAEVRRERIHAEAMRRFDARHD